MKTALVTGVLGQAGSYFAELLISKGFEVIGMYRRSSNENLWRVESLLKNPLFILERGDILDFSCIFSLLNKYKPSWFANFAGQSHVSVSFSEPIHTFDVTGKGVINCLEAIRQTDPSIKFLQLSSSELMGDQKDADGFQRETTIFNPRSPYAIAKLAGFHFTKLYREAYGMFAANSITFNMESYRRGENFVTRKITKYLAQYLHNKQNKISLPKLKLGNVFACRDWMHVKDAVKAMYLILNHDKADDWVVGTGETRTIMSFIEECCLYLGIENRDFLETNCVDFNRPLDVNYLRADSSKIRTLLGWNPQVTFKDLVAEMIDFDLGNIKISDVEQSEK